MIPASDPQFIIETLVTERDELKQHCLRMTAMLDQVGFAPGHFYSPLVDEKNEFAVKAVSERLSAAPPEGIDLDSGRLIAMMERLAKHYAAFPFPRHANADYRFHFDNPFFGCHDAFVLFAMLLEFRPRQVIEVGSGFSSRLILDTNERFLNNALDIILIDPALTGLSSSFGNIGPKIRLLACPVQSVPAESFSRLSAGDILLLDSSHVLKTGSDVHYYLFEIFPVLQPGVIVHIHDILYPFEYLPEWVLADHRNWNEAYAVRALLQNNKRFQVLYWNNFAFHKLTDKLRESMPLCLENEGGSLWLQVL